MNKDEVLQRLGEDVKVTYDVGDKGQPHVVSQHGFLKHYLDDPGSNAGKVCLLAMQGKIRVDTGKDKVPYTSCSILHYEDIVSIEPYVAPVKATA
jgi:hypothetical protein